MHMNETDKDTFCRRIVETVGDAVIFADRDGIIRLWNRAAEGIFGYAEAEAVGQSLDLIIPERQHDLHWKGCGKALLDGVTKYWSENLSVPAVTKDGERISIEFTINLLRDGDGKVLGTVAVVRNVTARWIREKVLRQRLAFLEAGQTAA
jgi:PAS domain S-box-containing protein